MATIKPANHNRIRRALKHIKAASAEIVNMKGKDMTSEYNAQRDKCLKELSKAFDAISNFRCIATNEQMIPKSNC